MGFGATSPSFGSSSLSAFGSSSSPFPPPNNQTSPFSTPSFGSSSVPAFGSSSTPVFGPSSSPFPPPNNQTSPFSTPFGPSSSPARPPNNQTSLFSTPSFGPSSSPSPPPNNQTSLFGGFASASSPFAPSNGVADIKQKMSKATAESPSLEQTSNEVVPKPTVEEAKPEVPSLEQDKVMDKSKSMVEEFQTKTGENSDESKAVDPIINTILNSGLNISLAKLPEELESEEAICKSDKFPYIRSLRGITHNPHFTPLQSYSKRSRERLIAGWDEIFEETVDHIQGLTTDTFRTNAHELWKTIAELENLGYNVARLSWRLDELTEVVKKRDSSEAEISHLKAKADDYRKEKKKIESDISGLEARADKAQVMVDELVDQVDKLESNLPVVDALFVNLAKDPL